MRIWLGTLLVTTVAVVIACSGDDDGPSGPLTTEHIELTPPGAPLRVGTPFDIVARAVDRNGKPTGSAISWTSSDSSVIRNGSVPEIIGPGTTTLTATADGTQASIEVSVIQSPVIAADANVSCVLDRDGAVYCWGSSQSGFLMRESNEPTNTPLKLPIDKRFTNLALGVPGACATTSLGEVSAGEAGTVRL